MDAFKLLYDKDRNSRIKLHAALTQGESQADRSALEQVASDVTNAAALAGASPAAVTVDLNKLLPELIKSAAGLAIALLLLGTLLLGGATFGTPAASAAPSSSAPGSATPSSNPAPSSS